MPKLIQFYFAEFKIADAYRRVGRNRQFQQVFLAAIAIFVQCIVIVAL